MAKYLSYTIRHKVSGLLKTVTVEEFEKLKAMSQNWKITARHETDNTEKALEKPVAQAKPTPKQEIGGAKTVSTLYDIPIMGKEIK